MGKRFLVIVVLLCMTVFGSFTAFAEVDEYGNEIDWDVNGSGNEDGAGGEEGYVPINADILEQEREQRSEEEMESIAAILETTEVQEAQGTGIVTVKFSAPEAWRGSNIVLVVYDQDMRKHEIIAYKQNTYEEKAELPTGEYTVYEARAVGDRDGLYPMMADIEQFSIAEGGQAVVVTISMAEILEQDKDKEEEVTPPVTPTENMEDDGIMKDTGRNLFWTNLPFLVIGLAAGALFYRVKRRKGEKKDDDDSVSNDW